MDKRKPESYAKIMGALHDVAPWAVAKLRYHEMTLSEARTAQLLPHGTSVNAVHVCGNLTDDCIALAESVGGHVAFMPCCYAAPRTADVPPSLVEALGRGLSTDCRRTRGLTERGYSVSWSAVPAAAMKKNRIVLGRRVAPRTPALSSASSYCRP